MSRRKIKMFFTFLAMRFIFKTTLEEQVCHDDILPCNITVKQTRTRHEFLKMDNNLEKNYSFEFLVRYIFDLQKLETNSLKGHSVASRHRDKKGCYSQNTIFAYPFGHWRNNIFWNFFVLRFKCKKIADTAQIRTVKKVTNVFSYRLAKWRT